MLTRGECSAQTARESKVEEVKEGKRAKKWIGMMEEWTQWSVHDLKRKKKLKSRVRKGVPDCVRCSAWKLFANVEERKRKYPGKEEITLEKLCLTEVTRRVSTISEEVG